MVAELLAVWGVKAAWSAFGPVLENLAKDVAKDAAKSYVGKCFGSVFSSKSDKTLIKATGQMIKELLDLLEYELGLDEDTEREELISMQRAAAAFLKQEAVQQAIVSLLKESQYQLDAAILAQAWRNVPDAPQLPDNFSWNRISKGFNRKAKEIRDSIPELKAVFAQELAMQTDKGVLDNLGPQPDFDLETYAEALLEKFGRPGSLALASIDLDGASYDAVRLWQVFVPQSAHECRDYRPQQLERPKGEEEREERLRPYFDQPPRPVLEACADQQLQRLVILGDPGSGKSSLLRFLALEWARESDPNRRALAPVPLLIELRDYHSKRRQAECSDNFLSYLHKAYSLHRFNQNALAALLQNSPSRFLLLLDGLDEIFDRQEREQVISDIHRFSNEYKAVRIIVTSRVVGYEAHRLRDAEFRDFMLQDFDAEQITQFLGRWHEVTFSFADKAEAERKRERLAKAINDSKPIALLAGNPLLLTLMAIINRNQELPRDRVRLYEKAAELLLQQWDTERYLQDFPGLSAEIDFRAKAAILRKVAVAMQTAVGKAANLIDGEQLIGLIEEYLREELRFGQARAAANALVRQLRERNFILCFVGGDSYAFVHRTFLEYFCAAEFVHQFEKKRSLSLDDLLALYDAHCREDDWQEVLRLICGQVDEQFAGKIIERLTGLVDLEKWDGETPLLELVLAVWCLSEVKNINLIDEILCGKLLLKVFDFFFIEEKTDSSYELFVAAKTVGERWPGKNIFQFDGLCPEQKKRPYSIYIRWFQLLAHIFRCRQWIEKFVNSENIELRILCISVIPQHWPDDETKQLLRERAVQDAHEDVRRAALEQLAEHWPDEETKQLLRERAAQDAHEDVRSSALKLLVEHWPDEEISLLLKKSISVVGIAASRHGKEHSHFGEIVFWRIPNVDLENWLNPRQPIPSEHIQKAAEAAGIAPDKIDEAVRSLSAHMGWDITKGSLAGKL